MGKIVKGALLGAGVSIGVTVVQGFQNDEPVDQLVRRAAKKGAVGAVGGATAGWVVDRVWSARAAEEVQQLVTHGPESALARAARLAAPAVESASELLGT